MGTIVFLIQGCSRAVAVHGGHYPPLLQVHEEAPAGQAHPHHEAAGQSARCGSCLASEEALATQTD
jgi:hypothetical protein